MEEIQQAIASLLSTYFKVGDETANPFSELILKHVDCDYSKLMDAFIKVNEGYDFDGKNSPSQNLNRNNFDISADGSRTLSANFFDHDGLPALYFCEANKKNSFLKFKREKRDVISGKVFSAKFSNPGSEEYKELFRYLNNNLLHTVNQHKQTQPDQFESYFDFGGQDNVNSLVELFNMFNIEFDGNLPLHTSATEPFKDLLIELKNNLAIDKNSEFNLYLEDIIRKLDFYNSFVELLKPHMVVEEKTTKNIGVDIDGKLSKNSQKVIFGDFYQRLVSVFGIDGELDFNEVLKIVIDSIDRGYDLSKDNGGKIKSSDIKFNGDGYYVLDLEKSSEHVTMSVLADGKKEQDGKEKPITKYNILKTNEGFTVFRNFDISDDQRHDPKFITSSATFNLNDNVFRLSVFPQKGEPVPLSMQLKVENDGAVELILTENDLIKLGGELANKNDENLELSQPSK